LPAPAAPVIRERSLSGETFDEVSVVVNDNGNDDDDPPPALKSPIKSRAHAIATSVNKKTDLDVWNMSDNDILGSDIFPYSLWEESAVIQTVADAPKLPMGGASLIATLDTVFSNRGFFQEC